MHIRWNYLRALGSILIPVLATFALVGWAEQQARLVAGGRSAGAPAVATATLSAYPLSGQPSGSPSAKATATPTRLAAYPLPGSTPTPTTSKSGTGPLSAQTDTLTYTLFLPIIRNDCYFKGTAGITSTAVEGDLWYSSLMTMGVCAGYEWYHTYTPTHLAYSRPWQVINDIRSRLYVSGTATMVITWNVSIDGGVCPGASGWYTQNVYDPTPAGQAALRACIQTIAASRPGLYWLIWNEPDDLWQDKFSPAQGAQFFREISNTILAGDPTARMIIGNIYNYYPSSNPEHGCPTDNPTYGCGVYWLTQFISEALVLGYDPRPYVAGYGFHAYSVAGYTWPVACLNPSRPIDNECHDMPLLANFTNSVMTAANWVTTNDIGKEVWLTELNWHGFDDTGWLTQTRRMTQICATLPTLPINRYFWYYGNYPWDPVVRYASVLTDGSGALSPAGVQFALPSTYGGCPSRP